MQVIAFIFNQLIGVYMFIVIVHIISSWLVAFNIVNPHNQLVAMILRTTHNLVEPALAPFRRLIGSILPNLGGIDVSPILLIIALQAFQYAVNLYVFAPLIGRNYGF